MLAGCWLSGTRGELGRLNVGAVAEVKRRGVEREPSSMSPKVKLISTFPTTEAVEAVRFKVSRETVTLTFAVGIVDWTGAANLPGLPTRGLESQ